MMLSCLLQLVMCVQQTDLMPTFTTAGEPMCSINMLYSHTNFSLRNTLPCVKSSIWRNGKCPLEMTFAKANLKIDLCTDTKSLCFSVLTITVIS